MSGGILSVSRSATVRRQADVINRLQASQRAQLKQTDIWLRNSPMTILNKRPHTTLHYIPDGK